MKNKLITALRSAANALENRTFAYNWDQGCSCNCGVVACVLLGKSMQQLANDLPYVRLGDGSRSGNWQTMVGNHCPITGIPENEMFKELFSHGLSAKDIVHLETLSDPRVLAKCDFGTEEKITGLLWWKQTVTSKTPVDYRKRGHVVVYLRAWANMLAEEQGQDAPDAESSAQIAQEAK